MAKLALLLGTTGCGKGWVIEQLIGQPQVLVVDLIRKDAINHLCRDLKPGVIHRWPIWDCLLEHFDVVPAIIGGIRNRCGEVKGDQPAVAEGGLLAHAGFREKFLEALKAMGCSFSETKTFFLDPPADRVRDYVVKRGRSNQLDYSLDDARQSVEWYQKQASGISDVRTEDGQQMVDEIDRYLSI